MIKYNPSGWGPETELKHQEMSNDILINCVVYLIANM